MPLYDHVALLSHLLSSQQSWHGSITEIPLHSSTLYSGKSKRLVHGITGLPAICLLLVKSWLAGCRSTAVKL
jgi:hypothetical protein